MKLAFYNEIVGFLTAVEKQDNFFKIDITVSHCLKIPVDAVSPELLDVFLGKKIGILNLDGEYFIRLVGD